MPTAILDMKISCPLDLTARMLQYAEAIRERRERFRAAARGAQGD